MSFERLYYRSQIWKIKLRVLDHLWNIGLIKRDRKFYWNPEDELYGDYCEHNTDKYRYSDCYFCDYYINDECTVPSIEYFEILIREFFRRCRLHKKSFWFFIFGIVKELYFQMWFKINSLREKLNYRIHRLKKEQQ